jgi:hypothetical protein
MIQDRRIWYFACPSHAHFTFSRCGPGGPMKPSGESATVGQHNWRESAKETMQIGPPTGRGDFSEDQQKCFNKRCLRIVDAGGLSYRELGLCGRGSRAFSSCIDSFAASGS